MMMRKIFLSLSVVLVFVSAIPIYGMGSESEDQPVGPDPALSPRSSPAAITDNMGIDEITDDSLRELGSKVTKLNILNGENITDVGISFLTELKELVIFGGTLK